MLQIMIENICEIIIQYQQRSCIMCYKKDSDSRESTESQLCNPMYLTPA